MEGLCAVSSPVEDFKEGKKYLLHLGDPYELEATVIGEIVLSDAAGNKTNFLLLQTDQGSILQCYTNPNGRMPAVEIYKEIS